VIRIQRPKTEPPALATQRRAGWKRAFAALNAHGAGSRELKDTLFLAQHRKCAYCERRVGLKGNAVEHLRPKKEAWRHLPGTSPPVIEDGYWWLTWTWTNQLFACTCHLAGPAWNALHYLVDPPRRTTANLLMPPRP
jgi:hypothetical protein